MSESPIPAFMINGSPQPKYSAYLVGDDASFEKQFLINATPASLAADSSGFLYSANITGSTYYFSFYAPWGTQSAYGYTHVAGTCTPSAPCSIASVGMSKPANMSIDPYDNLFFEEGTKGAAEMPVAGLAAGSGGLAASWGRGGTGSGGITAGAGFVSSRAGRGDVSADPAAASRPWCSASR